MHRTFASYQLFVTARVPSRRSGRSSALYIACRAASSSNPVYSNPLSEQRARQVRFNLCPFMTIMHLGKLWVRRRVSRAHVARLQDRCSICRDREATARRAAFQEIVSELSRTITRNGQRGIQRSFQALQAALSISTEYITNIQQGIQEPPQVGLMHLLDPSVACSPSISLFSSER